MSTQADKEKHKKRKDKQKKEHHGQPSKFQIRLKDASSLTDIELGQLLKTLASEAKTRSEQRNKELKDKKAEQVDFLDKCRNLAQSVMSGPIHIDTNKPLERAYYLFESMVSTLQAHIQETKEEQKEETARLLMA